MTQRLIRVTAGSRLHFGMLSFGHPRQRQFGGAGAMISAPATQLTISESVLAGRHPAAQSDGTSTRCAGTPVPAALGEHFTVSGPLASRVEEFVAHLSRHADWWQEQKPFQISVDAVGPAHAGLGSGTQLGMAVALGLARWCGARPQTAEALARAVGRGRRSAVGIHGACLGGLILEGGKLTDEEVSPLVSRVALPDAWRFVLFLPNDGTGLSGEAEQQAFERLPPVPAEVTGALCRELLCELVPAAARDDFERFSESLYRYGRLAGECFAVRQGGVYAGADIERLVMRCRDFGVPGAGQSSWGPTVFALCRDQREAESLSKELSAAGELRQRTTLISSPDNCGIRVEEMPGSKGMLK